MYRTRADSGARAGHAPLSAMGRGNVMLKKVFFFLVAVFTFSACSGCYESTPPHSGDGTERDPVQIDPDFEIDGWPDPYPDPYHDPYYDPYVDPVPDPYIDPYYDPYPDPDIPPTCPPTCMDIPSRGEIGAACVSSATCDHAASCLAEGVEFFTGEMYVENYQGQCILYGSGVDGCDPALPTTCPSGSRCIFLGTIMGLDYYGCWDACEPVDPSGNPYDFSCGCRIGYACTITEGVCMDGCSNDRECCERWWDVSGDHSRQPDEVALLEGCTNVCDNGGLFDDTTPEPPLCTASFACINNGDPRNHWGGPCEGDAWCPPDGLCLDEFHYPDPWTGEPYYPGGYCIKNACQYVGRGCSEHGGACANLGSMDYPNYACVGACHFGRTLDDPAYECRNAAGQEQACVPIESDFWLSPPPAGEDGYCWPGNFPGGSQPLGGSCRSDETCQSPFGLGLCLEFSGVTMTPFCSVKCSRRSARDYSLCGGGDAEGTAQGGCFSGICWDACPDPTASLGSNGCAQPNDLACYPTSLFGTYVDVGEGLEVPEGICIPRCRDDAWCEAMWGMPMTCNTSTGVCG